MPVFVALLGFFFPRVVLLFVWLLAPGPLEYVFGDNFLWLLAGFIFLPLTTLAYAFLFDPVRGSVHGIGLIAVVVAVLFDLGVIGTGARSRR